MKDKANENITVAVGLSGGLDSSMAAVILKEQGYNVIGLTMKIWDAAVEVQENMKHACYGPGEAEDIEEAGELCRTLGIPYHVFDLSDKYREIILENFRNEYLAGRTPNPCVLCNHKMKFGFLIENARKAGITFDRFATGHYARLVKRENDLCLAKAADLSKDQSYFLSGLNRSIFPMLMFPLGDMTKKEIREKAKAGDLSFADKAESQDFIAGGDYSPLFTEKENIPGNIVLQDGTVLGKHKGIVNYTIGQRKGLGISSAKPLYVMKIDSEKNEIIVTEKQGLFSEGFIIRNLNFLGRNTVEEMIGLKVRIRQKHSEVPAEIYLQNGLYRVWFETPQSAVSPGQTAVFYDDDVIAAAGVIDSVF